MRCARRVLALQVRELVAANGNLKLELTRVKADASLVSEERRALEDRFLAHPPPGSQEAQNFDSEGGSSGVCRNISARGADCPKQSGRQDVAEPHRTDCMRCDSSASGGQGDFDKIQNHTCVTGIEADPARNYPSGDGSRSQGVAEELRREVVVPDGDKFVFPDDPDDEAQGSACGGSAMIAEGIGGRGPLSTLEQPAREEQIGETVGPHPPLTDYGKLVWDDESVAVHGRDDQALLSPGGNEAANISAEARAGRFPVTPRDAAPRQGSPSVDNGAWQGKANIDAQEPECIPQSGCAEDLIYVPAGQAGVQKDVVAQSASDTGHVPCAKSDDNGSIGERVGRATVGEGEEMSPSYVIAQDVANEVRDRSLHAMDEQARLHLRRQNLVSAGGSGEESACLSEGDEAAILCNISHAGDATSRDKQGEEVEKLLTAADSVRPVHHSGGGAVAAPSTPTHSPASTCSSDGEIACKKGGDDQSASSVSTRSPVRLEKLSSALSMTGKNVW